MNKEWDDMEARRITILGRWFWATVLIVVFTFLYFLPRAEAQVDIPVYVIEQNGVTIRLLDKPCVDKVSLANIAPAWHAKFKALDSLWPEKDSTKKAYAGCWLEVKQGEEGMIEDVFILVFEDNHAGVFPKVEALKKMRLRGV